MFSFNKICFKKHVRVNRHDNVSFALLYVIKQNKFLFYLFIFYLFNPRSYKSISIGFFLRFIIVMLTSF